MTAPGQPHRLAPNAVAKLAELVGDHRARLSLDGRARDARAELEAMLHDEFGIDHTTLQVDHSQPEPIELSRKASRDPASAG